MCGYLSYSGEVACVELSCSSLPFLCRVTMSAFLLRKVKCGPRHGLLFALPLPSCLLYENRTESSKSE